MNSRYHVALELHLSLGAGSGSTGLFLLQSDSKIRSTTKQKFHFFEAAPQAKGEIHIWVVVLTKL